MDLRRERKKQNRLLGVAITISSVCFAIVAAIMIIAFSEPEIKKDYNSIGGLDSRAEADSLGLEGVSGVLNSKYEFSFEINSKIVFKDCNSSGKILLKNPLKNLYLMQAEIMVDEIVFLSTGNIAPGQIIKEVKPDIEISAGEYEAVAYISAIDPNNGKKLDTVKQNISVIIKK